MDKMNFEPIVIKDKKEYEKVYREYTRFENVPCNSPEWGYLVELGKALNEFEDRIEDDLN